MTLRITSLPAGHGDCLLIEYGKRAMLIDGGTTGTYPRLKQHLKKVFGDRKPHLDLFVITHIDADHIGGAVKLLEDADVTYDDIWFNGWNHLKEKAPPDVLGAKQAEVVSQLLRKRKLPWNEAFGGKAVVIDGKPRKIKLPGKLSLTLLSPYRTQLHKLIPAWRKELELAGMVDRNGNPIPPKLRRGGPSDILGRRRIDVEALVGEKFESDDKEANGSSIAFLLEYGKRRVLFTGDAHPGVLVDSLRYVRNRKIDLLKVSHHGSCGNTSEELLKRLRCRRYLISTNGAIFEHPDATAIARIVKHGGRGKKSLLFNYETTFNNCWKDGTLCGHYRYEALYPETKEGGITIEL